MLKRIAAILAVLITAVCMAGCQEAKADTNMEKSAQVIGEKLIFDDVNNIEINGVKVSLPFKAEELGEGFFIGDVVNRPCFRFRLRHLPFTAVITEL